jgi:hypothetical protein
MKEVPLKYRKARTLKVADAEAWYYINPRSIHLYVNREDYIVELHLTRREIANILSLMEKR